MFMYDTTVVHPNKDVMIPRGEAKMPKGKPQYHHLQIMSNFLCTMDYFSYTYGGSESSVVRMPGLLWKDLSSDPRITKLLLLLGS